MVLKAVYMSLVMTNGYIAEVLLYILGVVSHSSAGVRRHMRASAGERWGPDPMFSAPKAQITSGSWYSQWVMIFSSLLLRQWSREMARYDFASSFSFLPGFQIRMHLAVFHDKGGLHVRGMGCTGCLAQLVS